MSTETLPIDWNQWRAEWERWLAKSKLRRWDSHVDPPHNIPREKNFLADEVLGTFRTPAGLIVELSEVTFPALIGATKPDRHRHIGYTCAPWPNGPNGVVDSFRELEEVLGL